MDKDNTTQSQPENNDTPSVHKDDIISDLLSHVATEQTAKPQRQKSSDETIHFYFAGGGTGGHIYPALAVAEQLMLLKPNARITFFCSDRPIDTHILQESGYDFMAVPAKPFSKKPGGFLKFISAFRKSRKQTSAVMAVYPKRSVLISIGGFASAPVVSAARALKIPIAMINVDYVPGKANKLLGRHAREIFVQFPETKKYFGRAQKKVTVAGCPLRQEFNAPNPKAAIEELKLDKNKKTLLIIGGSSGAQSLNNAIALFLPSLTPFASSWQVVHVTGRSNYQQVKAAYTQATIDFKIVDYYHNMASLYAAADLLIGRAGAVCIAEYTASSLPSICLPYPYHKDNHQFLNAKPMVDADAAIIVNDIPTDCVQTAKKLTGCVLPLLKDEQRRKEMAAAAKKLAPPQAAQQIAQNIIEMIG